MDDGDRFDVSVIVLRYNGDPSHLDACVASVLSDAGAGPYRVEVLLVDNASTISPDAVEQCARRHGEPVRAMVLDRNHGFAGGVNRGIARTAGRLVLLLNDDAVLEPGAIAAAVEVLDFAGPDVVAVACKMLLASDPFLLDGVGIAVNGRGEAFNRGLGQPDLGQFDLTEDCLGPCFGAALVRRSAFGDDAVGPLEESYFLYYEDVEWSWRATVMGFRTITAPRSVVRHDMSASSRTGDYGFKHRFIEANLLASVARCFGTRRAVGIWARRWPALVKARVTGEFPRATGGAALDAARRLPATLRARRRIQARRRRDDRAVIAFADGERTFFDPVRYLPERSFDALATAAERRVGRGGDSAEVKLRWAEIARAARQAQRGEPPSGLRAAAVALDDRLGAYVDAASDGATGSTTATTHRRG